MGNLLSIWNFDSTLITFIVIILLFYFYLLSFRLIKKSVLFFMGLLVIIIALASPLHFLGMHYLFSAHMVAHVLVLLVAPPLMILGIPAENRFKKVLLLFSNKISKAPLIGWLAAVGIMWFWHIPYIYHHFLMMHSMKTEDNSIMILHNIHLLSLWIGGIIFWWVIIGPYKQYQIRPLTGILYLATACISCSLLGLLITFAPPNLYAPMNMNDTFGFNNLIRNQWGITNEIDQQTAGLIMWVPCCFIYLTASMLLLKKWLDEKEEILPVSKLNNLIIKKEK